MGTTKTVIRYNYGSGDFYLTLPYPLKDENGIEYYTASTRIEDAFDFSSYNTDNILEEMDGTLVTILNNMEELMK